MLLVLSGQVMELGSASDVQVLRWAGPPVGIVLFGLAIGSFQSLSGYDWRWRSPASRWCRPDDPAN